VEINLLLFLRKLQIHRVSRTTRKILINRRWSPLFSDGLSNAILRQVHSTEWKLGGFESMKSSMLEMRSKKLIGTPDPLHSAISFLDETRQRITWQRLTVEKQ